MESNEIIAIYGNTPASMTTSLIEHFDLASLIGDRNKKIALKPNLVVAVTPDTGATTHVEIVTSLITYLQNKGFMNIKIVESAWVGDSTKRGFEVNGYPEISRKYHVPLVDVKNDSYTKKSFDGITMEISDEILSTDFLISLPVLKGHCQTGMTCALKNMKGCLSDKSKRMFHTLGLHKPIAALNAIRHADLVIVDSICGDLDFEEGGTPIETNRMFACRDSVLMDSFGASLIGFDKSEVPYIGFAEQFKVGTSNLSKMKLTNLNTPDATTFAKSGRRVRTLEGYTLPDQACSACYGNLIHALSRLQETGQLKKMAGKQICIGQGYKEKKNPDGIGVGACTCGMGKHIGGCPAKASDIIDFLTTL